MNSHIYCLPQKLGWNSINTTSLDRLNDQQKYLNLKSKRPYPVVHFHKFPRESLVSNARQGHSGCGHSQEEYPSNQALLYSYNTQYSAAYGPQSVPPYWKPTPPKTHEVRPDQVASRRQYDPPIRSCRSNKWMAAHDADRGGHEWRQFLPSPGSGVWGEPMRRIPFDTYVGERNTLAPIRLIQHDPNHEKERWDTIRTLDSKNCLAYGYRSHMLGYTGHTQTVEQVDSHVARDVAGESQAMVSTVQASYRELPQEHYNHGQLENENKHRGPLSRMVTITHPFNPFTQQSAYSNMGATNTTTGSPGSK